ncbi:MAG: hypothetical protein ABH854_03950 [Candidatus Diapherotrites archaeon]|nr:hypothetical protein [Candidatus Micrarchaeota archaeon]MBU1939400.1 hypothetical protein [Candidatus Micrarchaeota archaeon]
MSLEAMISFAVFLAVLGTFAALGASQTTQAQGAVSMFEAKLESARCALGIDSFYANAGGAISGFKTACYMKGQQSVASRKEGFEKESAVLNPGTTLSQSTHGTGIEVKINEHYR